jgi:hypothetical protein
MNEKIFDLAEAHGWIDDFGRWNFQNDDKLLRFAEAIRQDEREACAKVCDELWAETGRDAWANGCAKAIRARGEK